MIKYHFIVLLVCAGVIVSDEQSVWAQDAVTGILESCEQLAREGPVGSGTLGLGVSTTICNQGDLNIAVNPLPAIDHPVMWGNMYRLETVSGSTRFEQIGQSWIKHSWSSGNTNECGLGCPSNNIFNEVLPLCSDTYAAAQFDACGLGSQTEGLMGPRSAIHPFTGNILFTGPDLGPGGGCDINFPSANHIGHNHSFDQHGFQGEADIMHRLQVPDVDVDATLHASARFFQEGGYITGEEFLLGNGNQHNNVSHREVAVVQDDIRGPGWHLFPNVSNTFEMSPAIDAWTGANQTILDPAPLADGRGILSYEATDLGGGQWHYEYAIFNQFNDASFGSFGVPIPPGVTVSNIGFHAPLNHAPVANADNYDNVPWTVVVSGGSINWSTIDFSSDPMANAIRWGTMYNFRFDANATPQQLLVSIGLFKLAETLNVASLGPQGLVQIPATSTWGIAVLALAIISVGVLVLRRRAPAII